MSIFEIWKIRGIKVPKPCERTLKIIMSPETTGTKELTYFVSIIPSNSTTCSHAHDVDEIMYIASGRGECMVSGRKSAIQPDSVIFAPKKVEHEIRNTGEETLKLICVFFPPLKPVGYIKDAIKAAKEKGLTTERHKC